MISSVNREASLAIRVQDMNNGYLIVFTPDHTQWADGTNNGKGGLRVVLVSNGVETYLDGYWVETFAQSGDFATLVVQTSGNLINVLLNGKQVVRVKDTSFSQGRVGIRIYGDKEYPCDSLFKSIVIK